MPKYRPGNQVAAKPNWTWTEAKIRAYQDQIRPVVEEIGPARMAALVGYSTTYVKLMAGYYSTVQQPSEEFVKKFEAARFLHFIRTVAVPFLKEREGQGPRPATWNRARVRATQKRRRR